MKKNKILLIVLIALIATGGIYVFVKTRPIDNTSNNSKVEENKSDNIENVKEEIKFLKEISGVKAENIELINDPVGLKGEFVAPRESILNGVGYFLKDTENSKMENIQIDIGNGYIYLTTTYKVNSFMSTPIEVKVKPSLDKNKNLVLEVSEFKFIDLNVPKWIVNLGVEGFVKDWFPEDKDFKVTFDEGRVVVDKSNYEKVILNNISIDVDGMKIDMIINLEKII